MEMGDAGGSVGHCVGGAAVVAEDLERLHPGQGVFDLCSDSAVLPVQVGFPLGWLAAVGGFAVGDDHLWVAAVGAVGLDRPSGQLLVDAAGAVDDGDAPMFVKVWFLGLSSPAVGLL